MHSASIFGAVTIVLGPAAGVAAADQSTSTSANPSTNPTSPSSVRVFLDLPYVRKGFYAMSVASACKDQTIYALQCTSYSNIPDMSDFCGQDAPTFTVTEGPSTFIASYRQMTTMSDQVMSATTVETCHITPVATVTCINTWNLITSASAALPHDWPTGGTGTVVDPIASSYYYQVAVTAGGDKLASATEVCKPVATNVAVGVEPRGAWAVAGALVIAFLEMFVW